MSPRGLLVASALALCACSNAATDPDGFLVQVSLDAAFDAAAVERVEIVLAASAGGRDLGFQPGEAQRFDVAGVRFTAEARNVDGDAALEYVYTFAESPLRGGVLQFLVASPGYETPAFEVRVRAIGSRGVLASAAVASLPDGSPLVLGPGRKGAIAVVLPCTAGLSCKAAANGAPVLAPLADGSLTLAEGRALALVLDAFDPDGDALTFSANAPQLAGIPGPPAFDPQTRTLRWTPPAGSAAAAPYAMTFRVEDGRGGADAKTLSVIVVAGAANSAPVWRPVGPILGVEGEAVEVTLSASDPDGDALTFSLDASALPARSDARLAADGSLFRWTPAPRDGRPDRPYLVRVTAQDARGASSSLALELRIASVNRAPLVVGPDRVTARAGQRLVLPFAVRDPDGDVVATTADLTGLHADGSPTFDPAALTLTWTPSAAAVRGAPWSAILRATDARGAVIAKRVELTVTADNGAPVFAPLQPLVVAAGELARFAVAATDPEGAAVTLELDKSRLPADNDARLADGVFTWTPKLANVRAAPWGPSFVARDPQGGEARVTALVGVVVLNDTTPPAAPLLASTSPTSPSRAPTAAASGTAEPGARVDLFGAAGCTGAILGTAHADASGAFSITFAPTANATTTLSAAATDPAGNVSPCSTPLVFVQDEAAPASVAITASTPASPSKETSAALVVDTEAGASVEVFAGDACAGSALASGAADSSGRFTTPALAVGANTATRFTARATDLAGNASACSAPFDFVNDTVAPEGPQLLAVVPASPSPNSAPTPNVTGNAEDGATVRVYGSADCAGAALGQGVAAGGTFAVAATVPRNATTAFYGTATDRAGNASGCAPSTVRYVHDDIPPTAPLLSTLSPRARWNQPTPTVGGLAEPGATVELYAGQAACGGAVVGRGVAASDGSFSVQATLSVPPAPAVVQIGLYARAIDVATNAGPCTTTPLMFTFDNEAPTTAPTLTPFNPPKGVASAIKVRGSASNADSVGIFTNATCEGAPAATGTLAQLASPGIEVTVEPGHLTSLSAAAFDAAGNASPCSAPIAYENDVVGPSAPALDSVPDSPSSNATPAIRVTVTDSTTATVQVFKNSACSGTPAASGAPTPAPGTATAVYTSPGLAVTARSTTLFYAQGQDDIGNKSGCAGPLEYVHDDTPPPDFTLAPLASSLGYDTAVRIDGTFAGDVADTTVAVYAASGCTGTPLGALVTSTRAFTLFAIVPQNGTTTFYAKATDLAGNATACKAWTSNNVALVYTNDQIAPAKPTIPGPPTNPILGNVNAVRLTGTVPAAEQGGQARLYIQGACSGTYQAMTLPAPQPAEPTVSRWTFDVTLPNPTPANGVQDFPFTVKVVDRALNESPCSAALTFRLDKQPPTSALVITSSNPPPPANNNFPTLALQTEPYASKVEVFTASSCGSGLVGATGALGADGKGSLTVGSPGVPDNATTTFYSRVTDQAGNVGPCSSTGFAYQEDSTGPPDPVLAFAVTTPAQKSPSSSTAPSLTVTTGAANTRVKLYKSSPPAAPCGGTEVATLGPYASAGTLAIAAQYTSITSLNGSTLFSARALDAVGNPSAGCNAFTYVHDSLAPAAPTLTAPALPSQDTTPTIGVTAEALSKVDLYVAASCGGAVAATLPEMPAGGAASVDVPIGTLLNQAVTITAKATDKAGNVGPCSAAVTYRHDTVAPTFAGVTGAARRSTTEVTLSWGAASDAATTAANMVYEVCAGTSPGSCASFVKKAESGAGQTSMIVGGLTPDARYWFQVRARDQAGNVSGTGGAEVTELTLSEGVGRALALGAQHVCATLADGTGRCFGPTTNTLGQLGNGTASASASPVTVSGLQNALRLGVGTNHTCAVLASGGVSCWGANDSGQLGRSSPSTSTSAVAIPSLGFTALSVSAGDAFTCAVGSDGAARCWGSNSQGRFGSGSSNNSITPVQVALPASTPAVQVASGVGHSCAVAVETDASVTPSVERSVVYCWGYGDGYARGLLGTSGPSYTPIAVLTDSASGAKLTTVKQVAAGDGHSCALLADSTVRCWGTDLEGRLGAGSNTSSATPLQVRAYASGGGTASLWGIKELALGATHSCGVHANGKVYCWGGNGAGQLGVTGVGNSNFATQLTTSFSAVSIAARGNRTCALAGDGATWCWGEGFAAQTRVSGISAPTRATQVSAGSAHSCGLLSDGLVRCWGNALDGRLGIGSDLTQRTTPTAVAPGGPMSARVLGVSAGYDHSCAVHENGTLSCWGRNNQGQLGNGVSGSSSSSQTPVAVGIGGAFYNVVAVSAGAALTCALRVDGAVFCWGTNYFGELGNGTTTPSNTPTLVTGLPAALSVAAGYEGACAVTHDHKVWCWGQGKTAGIGATTYYTTTAIAVPGTQRARQVTLHYGGAHACDLRLGGFAQCWGLNASGQIGDGTGSTGNENRYTPTTVLNLAGGGAIATGGNHTCARNGDGTALCWGAGYEGELGAGSGTTSSFTPLAVPGLTNVAAIEGGSQHTCALLGDGTVRCFGQNDGQSTPLGYSRLGDGTTTRRFTPTPVLFFP